MRLHFEKHGHEEVLRILEAKYRRNYRLWKAGKWLPTKIQLKRMKKSGFRFPTNQKTVPPKTKMKMIHITKPNLDFLEVQNVTKKTLNENEPLANYRRTKRASAKVDSQETVASKELLEKYDQLQGRMNEKTRNIKTLEEKLGIFELKSDDLIEQNKNLKETITRIQGQLDNESKRVKDLVGKLGNEQKKLKEVQQSCDLALKGALKENAEKKVINYT